MLVLPVFVGLVRRFDFIFVHLILQIVFSLLQCFEQLFNLLFVQFALLGFWRLLVLVLVFFILLILFVLLLVFLFILLVLLLLLLLLF